MDACFKMWFGDVTSALHLAVDKATKKVLFGWFEPEETTRGYFVVLFHILLNYGIPYKIKTDNRTTFSTNKKKKKDNDKDGKTQFSKICDHLGILLETTSNATSKANVERENKTFKDRLISELRHEGITKIDDANEYLNNNFIPRMNTLFSYDINEKTSMMKRNNYTPEELNLIISERCKRIIDNASSISLDGKYYVPISDDGEIMTFKHRTDCIVIIAYDGTYWGEIENNYYHLQMITTREKITHPKENKAVNEAPKPKYKPPANHPWRKSMGKFFNKS